jgi:hypothetical protein
MEIITSNNVPTILIFSSDVLKKSKLKRRTKEEKFEKERKNFIEELYNVAGFDKKDFICASELEENEKIKSFLIDNINKIRKYWKTGLWSYFLNKNKDDVLSLFKTLINNSTYKLYSKQKVLIINNIKKRYTVYYIEK